MEKRHSSSAAYNINYHFVWCPKYRKKILVGNVVEHLDLLIRYMAARNGCDVLELKVMPDHVHLFVQCRLTDSPADVVKILKGMSDIHLFRRFPDFASISGVGYCEVRHIMLELPGMCLRKPLNNIIRKQKE